MADRSGITGRSTWKCFPSSPGSSSTGNRDSLRLISHRWVAHRPARPWPVHTVVVRQLQVLQAQLAQWPVLHVRKASSCLQGQLRPFPRYRHTTRIRLCIQPSSYNRWSTRMESGGRSRRPPLPDRDVVVARQRWPPPCKSSPRVTECRCACHASYPCNSSGAADAESGRPWPVSESTRRL